MWNTGDKVWTLLCPPGLWDPPSHGSGLSSSCTRQEHSPWPRFAALKCEAVRHGLGVLGTGEAWPYLATDLQKPICRGHLLWAWTVPDVGENGAPCLWFLHRFESISGHVLWKCLLSIDVARVPAETIPAPDGWPLMELCRARQSWEAARLHLWRQILWTFPLCYSVGLWFCLKAVHRRETCGESLLFSLALPLSLFFFSFCDMFTFTVAWDFFALLECIERLYPLFKEFLGYPFVVHLIRLDVKCSCVIILI